MRRQIILRSDALHCDDFGALFAQMFGDRYADALARDRNIHIGGVYGRYDGISFRHMQYQGDFTVDFPSRYEEITFVMPLAGKVVFNHGGQTQGVAQVGLALDKGQVRSVSFLDNHAQHGFSISRALLVERLATLLGRPIVAPLHFAPTVDLTRPAFQGLRALLEMATGEGFELLVHSGSLMPRRLREMLVDAVLEAWPHSYGEALRQPALQVAPRHVKRAIDCIHASADGLVSGAELARLSHVSLRALQDGFRRFVGQSIVEYQRQVRLQRAHDLLALDGSVSVTQVAARYGFSNVGRFSQYFQQAYGVSPVQARKASRGGPD